jgi:acetyl-CoA acetyltransferase
VTRPVYIFDAIRTPRSKGKADGSLHEIKPVNLVTGLLVEMQRRHDLDTSRVDDVNLRVRLRSSYVQALQNANKSSLTWSLSVVSYRAG